MCSPYQYPCLWMQPSRAYFQPFHKVYLFSNYYPATCLAGEGSSEHRCCTCQRGYGQNSSLYTKEILIFSTLTHSEQHYRRPNAFGCECNTANKSVHYNRILQKHHLCLCLQVEQIQFSNLKKTHHPINCKKTPP